MKITFNLLAQKYGSNTNVSSVVRAMGDLLPDSKKTRYTDGYITYDIEDVDFLNICEFFELDYWPFLEVLIGVFDALKASEITKYGNQRSIISSIELLVKATPTFLTTTIPAGIMGIAENTALGALPTLSEWMTDNVVPSEIEGYLYFPLLKGTAQPDMYMMFDFISFADSFPALEIEMLTVREYRELVSNNEEE
jgi:hypothetical protein